MANGTVGAVAGDEIGDVGRLLPAVGRLKRCAHPVFVLLPQAQYTRLHARWSLPEIASDVRHDAPPDHGSADTPGASPQP